MKENSSFSGQGELNFSFDYKASEDKNPLGLEAWEGEDERRSQVGLGTGSAGS